MKNTKWKRCKVVRREELVGQEREDKKNSQKEKINIEMKLNQEKERPKQRMR